MEHSTKNMRFFVIMNFLKKALENERGEDWDYYYASLYIFRENTASFLLSLLNSTPNLTFGTPILQEPWDQIQSKALLGSQHTAWLIMACLAEYDTIMFDLLSYSKALNDPNATQ